ncbi:857_t:CDS:2 [Funneliformis geosporum]|uniref:7909_t:CDS:1 n=1 Tax=Funneliformis geosporum TaxID=1117311 RepID=A0A9W4WNI2_9GLOM|nr:7909_t:CDS:2 [Funneliformis geosporum]CAI2168047.1 857_t:CDS:2 [Funneliformis geosporum]
MLTTNTSRQKDKKDNKVWILTIVFSPCKAIENSIDCRGFVSKNLAKGAMKREAWRLYKNSKIIQGADDKYFNAKSREVQFGESLGDDDYRREFGFCTIKPLKLENEESGDEMPSGMDI